MLHAVYLIHQRTGICLINRKYGSIDFNQDLVSGFLTALKDFSIEFSKGAGELKVVDMRVFYLMLVFKHGILFCAAADKNDDAKICHKKLSQVISKFNNKFGDKIEDWNGDVRIFKGFDEVIDDVLEEGKVAEVPMKIPILKIFKKDFKKSQKKIAKKGMVLSEEDLKKEADQKPEWTKKRLPKVVITQGFLDKEQYEIAHLADGFHTIPEIAEEAGKPVAEVQSIIDRLDELKLLKFVNIK
jgi:hypothetical protein